MKFRADYTRETEMSRLTARGAIKAQDLGGGGDPLFLTSVEFLSGM